MSLEALNKDPKASASYMYILNKQLQEDTYPTEVLDEFYDKAAKTLDNHKATIHYLPLYTKPVETVAGRNLLILHFILFKKGKQESLTCNDKFRSVYTASNFHNWDSSLLLC